MYMRQHLPLEWATVANGCANQQSLIKCGSSMMHNGGHTVWPAAADHPRTVRALGPSERLSTCSPCAGARRTGAITPGPDARAIPRYAAPRCTTSAAPAARATASCDAARTPAHASHRTLRPLCGPPSPSRAGVTHTARRGSRWGCNFIGAMFVQVHASARMRRGGNDRTRRVRDVCAPSRGRRPLGGGAGRSCPRRPANLVTAAWSDGRGGGTEPRTGRSRRRRSAWSI
ncbi:hypothetical protein HYPSUDRAFT_215010, partial [Hypholoma sublateritium FD-334 SS-4]